GVHDLAGLVDEPGGRKRLATQREGFPQTGFLDGTGKRARDRVHSLVVFGVSQTRFVAADLDLAAAVGYPDDGAGAGQFGGAPTEVLLAHAVDAVAMLRHQRAQVV